jgi:hypothetical protein
MVVYFIHGCIFYIWLHIFIWFYILYKVVYFIYGCIFCMLLFNFVNYVFLFYVYVLLLLYM